MILASIKPYYYYLIAEEKKKIEVRKTALKNLPQDIAFYMSKDEKSFARIPKEFQEKYRKHFGKVGLKATCNGGIFMIPLGLRGFEESKETLNAMCLTNEDLNAYGGLKTLYGWHITDLKVYDKPKELSEFYKLFKYDGDGIICGTREEMNDIYEFDCETVFGKIYPDFSLKDFDCKHCPKARDFYRLTRPPQSWQYIEEVEE